MNGSRVQREARVSPASAEPKQMLLLSVACAAVALGVLVQGLPRAKAGCCLPPDAVGYVATAHNWLEGAGFVDPVLYSHYLSGARPPIPAFAVRPPGVSVLLIPVLALGADLNELLVCDVVWSSLVAIILLLVARRSMSLPAATGFALAVTWSPIWTLLSPVPLSEVTAVAVLFLAMASLRRGTASVRGALCLALLTAVAWMVRPNLVLVLPAAVLAVAIECGPAAALRHRPLWVYVGSFVLLNRVIVWTATAITGFAPYAHYGLMAEIVETSDAFLYGKEYVGWLAFLEANRGAVLAAIERNLQHITQALFVRDLYSWVGWLGVPGTLFALVYRGKASLEQRFAAFSALGFLFIAAATYGGYDEHRYPLFGAACMWYTALCMLDTAASWAARAIADRRGNGRAQRAAVLGLPLVVVLMLYGFQGGPEPIWSYWRRWEAASLQVRPLCGRIARGSIVASGNPWWLHLACGNPGYRLPEDLSLAGMLDRYLDEQQPRYLLVLSGPKWGFLRESTRLERIATANGLDLFEVSGARAPTPPWPAPQPLVSRR